MRNDQLYDELVGRAAAIERSLGLPDGAFANRPRPWLTIRFAGLNWTVDHRTGISLIYAASVALWLFGVLAPVLEFARGSYLRLGFARVEVSDPLAWVHIFALAMAVGVTMGAFRLAGIQRKQRSQEMASLALRAVERASALELAEAANDTQLLGLCTKLSGESIEDIRARANFYAKLDPDSMRFYFAEGSKEQTASHLVALLTDLPPRWIHDCFTGRRRQVNMGSAHFDKPT